MQKMKPILRLLLPLGLSLLGCARGGFTPSECRIIENSDSVMYVTTIWHPSDSLLLRTPSTDLPPQALRSPLMRTLVAKMNRTVLSPQQDGVGLAAPQVGINRRVIVVWREDKPGQPFETYANVHLEARLGDTLRGPEGCLSVPPYRGTVPRSETVIVSYIDMETLQPHRDTVQGYAAIIFQHECDHLDGKLYIDRADTVFYNDAWAAERAAFDYSRPAWME